MNERRHSKFLNFYHNFHHLTENSTLLKIDPNTFIEKKTKNNLK
jgi:hypothetical protein